MRTSRQINMPKFPLPTKCHFNGGIDMSENRFDFAILNCREIGTYIEGNDFWGIELPELEIVSFDRFKYDDFERINQALEDDTYTYIFYSIDTDRLHTDKYDEYHDRTYPVYYIDKEHFDNYWKPQILED